MAPPPCEACAAGQGVPPPPGKACRARRGIATNRVRRAAAADVRSVPVPPWGEACHLCTQETRGAAANTAVACRRQRTVCPLVYKQLVCRQAPVQHHLLGHCQLVEDYLLVITSCPDPIIYIYIYACWIIVAAISSLGTRGPAAWRGVRCRARRAATTRQGVLGEAWHPRQTVKVCRRSRHEERGGAAVRRGVPSIHSDRACSRHQANRGAAAVASEACLGSSPPLRLWFLLLALALTIHFGFMVITSSCGPGSAQVVDPGPGQQHNYNSVGVFRNNSDVGVERFR